MFPGAITVEVDADPEEPDNPFVIFNVVSPGDNASIIEKQRHWRKQISKALSGSSGHLRLSVFPV